MCVYIKIERDEADNQLEFIQTSRVTSSAFTNYVTRDIKCFFNTVRRLAVSVLLSLTAADIVVCVYHGLIRVRNSHENTAESTDSARAFWHVVFSFGEKSVNSLSKSHT